MSADPLEVLVRAYRAETAHRDAVLAIGALGNGALAKFQVVLGVLH